MSAHNHPFMVDCIDPAALREQIAWSAKTFGPGPRTKGLIKHIKKELEEIEESPLDLYEWIDIIILGIDGAQRTGRSADDIIAAYKRKMAANFARTWPDWRTANPDEPIEHDRSTS